MPNPSTSPIVFISYGCVDLVPHQQTGCLCTRKEDFAIAPSTRKFVSGSCMLTCRVDNVCILNHNCLQFSEASGIARPAVENNVPEGSRPSSIPCTSQPSTSPKCEENIQRKTPSLKRCHFVSFSEQEFDLAPTISVFYMLHERKTQETRLFLEEDFRATQLT